MGNRLLVAVDDDNTVARCGKDDKHLVNHSESRMVVLAASEW